MNVNEKTMASSGLKIKLENGDIYLIDEDDDVNSDLLLARANCVIKEEPELAIVDIDGDDDTVGLETDSECVDDESSPEEHSTENDLNHSKEDRPGKSSASGYKCTVCDKRLKEWRSFRCHMARHNNKPLEFHCRFCTKSFGSQSTAVLHERGHTGEKPYACDQCPMKFSFKNSLKRHHLSHSGEKRFQCDECSKCFISKDALHQHQKTHSTLFEFRCQECSQSFKIKRSLTSHIKSKHSKGDKEQIRTFVCEECQMEFPTTKSLNLHRQNHARGACFRCAICSLEFSIRYQYLEHMNTHEGNFQCQQCDRRFRSRGNLIQHETVHDKNATNYNGESMKGETWACDECPKTFKSKCSLRRHSQMHSDQPFKCEICAREFKLKSYYREHMKLHTGQRAYNCVHCGKSFRSRAKLELHKTLHLNHAYLKVKSETITLTDEEELDVEF